MVDDIVTISECGHKTTAMNAFIDTKASFKKLQCGVKKCKKLHIGKTKSKIKCQNLEIGDWKVKNVKSTASKEAFTKEEYHGETEISESEDEKYLGDIISKNAKNAKNISAQKCKSIGISRKIMSSLQDIYFGKFHFEVAILMRNSLMISSLLTNSEAWHNLTEADLRNLEQIDEALLSKILATPISTPKEMLYLELGVIPIRFIIKSRRLNFLKYLLDQSSETLVSQVLVAQLTNPTRNDWGQTIKQDLEEIGLEIDDVNNMTKNTLGHLLEIKLRPWHLNI